MIPEGGSSTRLDTAEFHRSRLKDNKLFLLL